jgi:hypothetical protein
MATFADYPTQTMASNTDFPLYSYPDVWSNDHSYLSASTYPDASYMNTTQFDAFQDNQTFAQQEQYSFGTDQTFMSKQTLQPSNATFSPTNSASHSFDTLNPPNLSSNSDSGASVQSTRSSAAGSPSAHPQTINDWTQQAGLDMLPSIVQPDAMANDVFATTAFDFDTIPATVKGCVGESTDISSSQLLPSAPLLNTQSFSNSFDLLRETGSFAQSSPIDRWSLPAIAPPTRGSERNLSVVSTVPSLNGNRVGSTSPNDSVFRSPTTPASATSPVIERVKGKRQPSVTPPTPKRMRLSSPLAQTMSYTESDLPARPQAPPPTFSSPFFSQSSGTFVPPLELSCPSPSPSRISFFLVSLSAEMFEHLLTNR